MNSILLFEEARLYDEDEVCEQPERLLRAYDECHDWRPFYFKQSNDTIVSTCCGFIYAKQCLLDAIHSYCNELFYINQIQKWKLIEDKVFSQLCSQYSSKEVCDSHYHTFWDWISFSKKKNIPIYQKQL